MSAPKHGVLITSASGNIGQALLPQLLASPQFPIWTVVLPTRNASKLRGLIPHTDPLPSNIVIAEGDVADALWLESLLREHSVRTVYSNFSGLEELVLSLNLWNAAKRAGVSHLIYLSSAIDYSIEAVKAGALENMDALNTVGKLPLEHKLMYGRVPFTWTILGPTFFFTNDLRNKDSLLADGRFLALVGSKGASLVDTKDIALAVVKGLEDGGKQWAGKKIWLGSRKSYSADEILQTWAKALGKEVKRFDFGTEDYSGLERVLRQSEKPEWARTMVNMIHEFDLNGFGMNDEQYQQQLKFLGKEPTDYEVFVKETVAEWKKGQ